MDVGRGGLLGLGPCAVVDVHYPEAGGARTGLVVAGDVRAGRPWQERVTWSDAAAPYEPGEFWRRELPQISAALQAWQEAGGPVPGLVVVDGYVTLDPSGRPGLGWHVHQALGVAVIGIAKTSFATATHAVPVLRGTASRPLLVTAAGVDVEVAAAAVASMAGASRLPDAARRADRLARGAVPE